MSGSTGSCDSVTGCGFKLAGIVDGQKESVIKGQRPAYGREARGNDLDRRVESRDLDSGPVARP
jgi:hypothetical protein